MQMKKLFCLVLTTVLIGFSSLGFADMKIGVLDLNKVLMNSPQVKSMQVNLKKQFDPRGQELLNLQKALQGDLDKYNKISSTLKGDGLKQEQQKILDEQKKLQDSRNVFQRDLITAQNQAMQTILKQVETVVNRIAANQKFDLIVTKISLAYNDPKLEITDQVIAALK
jgi:outer membrane protein